MRTIYSATAVYSYDELSDEAKDTALKGLWDLNVHDSFWYECTIEEIDSFGRVSGLYCEYGKEFDFDRGSYISIVGISSTFTDLEKNYPLTLSQYRNVALEVIKPFLDTFSAKEKRQLARLERVGALGTLSGETSQQRRGIRYDVETSAWDQYKRCIVLIDKLADAWKELIRDLEHYYVEYLRREYEYATSREAIEEAIISNEYEFTAEGERV